MRRLVIGAVLVGIATVSVVGTVRALSLSGISAYRITTGSMEPVLPTGTIVITRRTQAPQPGRVTTFRADGRIVTHVLVGFDRDGRLITRGIANAANDAWQVPVYRRDVIGQEVRHYDPRTLGLISGFVGITAVTFVVMVMAGRSCRKKPWGL